MTGRWVERWTRLMEAGLTFEQAVEVYHVVEDARGHHTASIAASSWAALNWVYAKEETV